MLPDFNKLWNYGDPAATEAKFREILPQAEASGDIDYHAQLLTQIARTYSLRSRFPEAHALLDQAEVLIAKDPKTTKLAHVRCLLERGRTFNSAGELSEAASLFERAYDEARGIGENRYAIDAVHMSAIAQKDPKKQVAWNLKGIEMASSDPNGIGWLNALYNNIGESYALLGEYDTAYEFFDRLTALQSSKGKEADMYTLKDKARMKRLAGDPEASRKIMMPVWEKLESSGKDDGWIHEELAEALYALGNPTAAKLHFVKAYELLSIDPNCIEHEKNKLTRLKQMAG